MVNPFGVVTGLDVCPVKQRENVISEKAYGQTFLFVIFFKYSQSIHSKIPQGVLEDLVVVLDKTNGRTNSENRFFGRHLSDSPGRLLQRECYCPGIALREHEAKLHFTNLRAIPGFELTVLCNSGPSTDLDGG